MVTFSQAVNDNDFAAIADMLAEDVVFHSPVAFKPYRGKAITFAILQAVSEVFEDLRYVREISDDGSGHHAYMFEAIVDGLSITGCDFLVCDDAGKIVDFMVMVRPLKAAQALAARMGERFPDIQAAASAQDD